MMYYLGQRVRLAEGKGRIVELLDTQAKVAVGRNVLKFSYKILDELQAKSDKVQDSTKKVPKTEQAYPSMPDSDLKKGDDNA